MCSVPLDKNLEQGIRDTGEESDDPAEPIVVQVDEAYLGDVDAADLVRAIALTLRSASRPPVPRTSEPEVTLVVTGDEAVRALNLQFLGEDRATDVLSFPAGDDQSADGTPSPFVSAPGATAYLGDIVIALPYASRQAAELGHALLEELRLLAVHGTLHLLGYDHAEQAEEAEMWAQQDAILAQLTA